MEKKLNRSASLSVDLQTTWSEVEQTWSDQENNVYKTMIQLRNANNNLCFELYGQLNDVLTELCDLETLYPIPWKN